MTLRIAINGFGRIGRNVLRALYTQGYRQDLQIVAINDLGDSAINAHLLKYDTVHGTFDATVEHDQERVEISAPVTHIPDRNTAYDNEDWMDAAIEAFSGLNDAFMRAEEAFERMKTRLASIAQPST